MGGRQGDLLIAKDRKMAIPRRKRGLLRDLGKR